MLEKVGEAYDEESTAHGWYAWNWKLREGAGYERRFLRFSFFRFLIARRRGEDVTISRHLLPSLALLTLFLLPPPLPLSPSSPLPPPYRPPRRHGSWITNLIRRTARVGRIRGRTRTLFFDLLIGSNRSSIRLIGYHSWFDGNFHSTSFTRSTMSQLDSRIIS